MSRHVAKQKSEIRLIKYTNLPLAQLRLSH